MGSADAVCPKITTNSSLSSESVPDQDDWRCELCNHVYAQKRYFIDHLKRKRHQRLERIASSPLSSESVPAPDDLRCESCDHLYSRKSEFLAHLKTKRHQQGLQGLAAKDGTTISSSSPPLSISVPDDLRCEPCNYVYSKKSHFIEHLTTKRHQRLARNISITSPFSSESVPVPDDIRCELCDRSYSRKKEFRAHLKTKLHQTRLSVKDGTTTNSSSSSSALPSISVPVVPDDLKCELCNHVYSKKLEFIRHLKTKGHLQRQRFTNGVANASSLLLKSSTHADLPSFKCEPCNAVFVSEYNLQRHLMTKKHELAISSNAAAASTLTPQMELDEEDVADDDDYMPPPVLERIDIDYDQGFLGDDETDENEDLSFPILQQMDFLNDFTLDFPETDMSSEDGSAFLHQTTNGYEEDSGCTPREITFDIKIPILPADKNSSNGLNKSNRLLLMSSNTENHIVHSQNHEDSKVSSKRQTIERETSDVELKNTNTRTPRKNSERCVDPDAETELIEPHQLMQIEEFEEIQSQPEEASSSQSKSTVNEEDLDWFKCCYCPKAFTSKDKAIVHIKKEHIIQREESSESDSGDSSITSTSESTDDRDSDSDWSM